MRQCLGHHQQRPKHAVGHNPIDHKAYTVTVRWLQPPIAPACTCTEARTTPDVALPLQYLQGRGLLYFSFVY